MLKAEDFYIALPSPIATLDDVPAEVRAHYVESGGAFALTAAARDEIARCNAEMDEIVAAGNAELAAERAQHERSKASLRDRIIDGALDDALAAHGAQRRLRNGARAYLKSQWRFRVADDERVTVLGPGGETPVDRAVADWLASDAGSAFAAAPPPEQRGVFARLLAR